MNATGKRSDNAAAMPTPSHSGIGNPHAYPPGQTTGCAHHHRDRHTQSMTRATQLATLVLAGVLATGCATTKETKALRTRMADLEARMTEQAQRSDDYVARYQSLREEIELELARARKATDTMSGQIAELESRAQARVRELNAVIQESAKAGRPVEEQMAKRIQEEVARQVGSASAASSSDLDKLKADIAELQKATLLSSEGIGAGTPARDLGELDRKLELMRTDVLKRISNLNKDNLSMRSLHEDRFDELNRSIENLTQALSEALKVYGDQYNEAKEASRRALNKLDPTIGSPAPSPSPVPEKK